MSKILIILSLILPALACDTPIATTTNYYLPDAKKMCGRYNVKCPKFLADVKLQGSGILSPGKLLDYKGRIRIKDPNCPTTDTSASGACLIPYISVAADRRYHNMGDIIQMPAMKGKKLKMPDGKYLIHPGFFIIHDTGGAISGRNRFDFFSGTMDLYDGINAFGYKGASDTAMYAEKNCSERKRFSKVKPGSREFALARQAIDQALVAMAKTQSSSSTQESSIAN